MAGGGGVVFFPLIKRPLSGWVPGGVHLATNYPERWHWVLVFLFFISSGPLCQHSSFQRGCCKPHGCSSPVPLPDREPEPEGAVGVRRRRWQQGSSWVGKPVVFLRPWDFFAVLMCLQCCVVLCLYSAIMASVNCPSTAWKQVSVEGMAVVR